MSRLRVIPLVCPDCGQHLTGLRYDRIFFCLNCGQGLEPGEREQDWDRHPLRFAEPPSPPQIPRVYLPMWEVSIAAEAMAVTRAQEVSLARLNDLKAVWVMGFNMVRPSYYGDLGQLYTERGIFPARAEKSPAGAIVAGCSRTLADTLRYVKLFVTLILDKRADVTGLSLEINTRGAALWAVPFADYGDKIMDLISGTMVPAVAVDDLEALRRMGRKQNV